MDLPFPLVVGVVLIVMIAAVALGLYTRSRIRGPYARAVGRGVIGGEKAYTIYRLSVPWDGARDVAVVRAFDGFDVYRADDPHWASRMIAGELGRIRGGAYKPEYAMLAFGYQIKGSR